MKRPLILAGLLAIAASNTHAGEPALFYLSVKDVPVENGKVLDMEFHEIQRNADSSTVQIVRRSGGSVSSSMFILRGMCGLARARKAQYFATAAITGGENERYKVTFPQAAPEPGTGFTLAQCDLLRY
jgi:hypothetical protein